MARKGQNKIKVFAGRYAYNKPLGRGAGGSVYLAEDLHHDRRQVALKVLTPEAYGTVQGKMLRREFEILSKLEHPNLVRVYDYGRLPDGGVYLAEEYIDGFSLQDARMLMQPEALLGLTMQILDGLAYLHGMGMIHRDIKPANVMLLLLASEPSNPMMAKLVDFGLSSMDPKRDTLRGGTRSYMAPEIIKGEKGEPRSDLFSLGVTLYYAMCGVLPFGPRSKDDPPPTDEPFRPPEPHRLNPEVPLTLSRFTMVLLRQVPDVEFMDAGEALQGLASDLGGEDAAGAGQFANAMNMSAPQVLRGFFERGFVIQHQIDHEYMVHALTEDRDAGRGRIWLITGQEGTGKSRLLREVETSCKLSGRLVVSVGARAGSSPWALMADVLRRVMQLTRHHAPNPLDKYREALGTIERLGEVDRSAGPVLLGEQGAWVRMALRDAAAMLVEERLAIFMEDVHEADEESLTFLHAWFASPEQTHRVDVVVTARPDKRISDMEELDAVSTVVCEGLQFEDVEELFHHRMGLKDISTSWMDEVVERAKGKTDYLEEVARYLVDTGVMQRRSAERWEIEQPGFVAYQLPSGVADSFRRRLGVIGATGRELLELLSILNRKVTWSTLRALAVAGGEPEESVDRAIETLQWRHFILVELEMSGRYVALIHPTVKVVVEMMLSPEWRRALHRRIAGVLGASWERGEGEAREVAHHYIEGGRAAQAAPFAWSGAQAALQGGRFEQADAAYERVVVGDSSPKDRAIQGLERARCKLARFDTAGAEEALEAAVEDADGDDWLCYRSWTCRARAALTCGEPMEALQWLERVNTSLGYLSQTGEVLELRGHVSRLLGEVDEAMRLAEESQRRYVAQGHVLGMIRCAGVLARLSGVRGDTEAAGKHLQLCYDLAKRYEFKAHLGEPLLVHARLMRLGQEGERAVKLLSDALESLGNDERYELWVELLVELSEAYFQEQDYAGAQRCAEQALELARRLGHEAMLAYATILAADVPLHRGDGGDEVHLARMEEALETLTLRPDFIYVRAESARRIGLAMARLGRRAKAQRYLDRSAELGARMGAAHMYPASL